MNFVTILNMFNRNFRIRIYVKIGGGEGDIKGVVEVWKSSDDG